ncbi:MAG TPA: RHS repeat-associated core domain-containing protein, partial [Ktedonobacterales bacterium]|nr:RHS repeat-associated core domain-containing protein [Ktedonobacterales bacterium]
GVATTTSVFTVSAAPPDTLFSDNFEQDTLGAAPAGWSVTSGTWAVENDGTHVLQQTDTTIASSVYITPSVAGSANWTNYTVSADVKPGADNTSVTSANLMGRYTDTNNHYSLILKNNSEWWLGVKQAGNWTTIANGTFSYNSNTFYTLTLSLQGTTISGSINGTVVGSGTDSTFSSGGIGFSTAANSEIDNVSVVDGTGQGGGSPPPAPMLTSLTPTSGAVGSTVTLSGSGFTGASSVAFHGTLASSFTVVSATQLTAVVPQGATSGLITVTTPGGSATSSGSFTVTATPPPPPPTTTTTTAYYGGGLAESVNGTLSYLLSDPVLGSASASVNLSGQVVATQLYAPYGAVRYASGILPTDYGFTHQRVDATSGLDDYGARWYDPLAGQFTSADTTLAGGLNRYAYVAGNPETRTDPSGHVYAQRTTPYYQDFGAAVYNLIAKDQGHAGNGMSTALFIARYDADAYRSAEAFGARHGVLMMPHVGEDANTYVGAMTKAHAGYWNSSSAAMLEYVQLRALSHDAVVANTGVRSGDLNLFNADWQPMLRATGRPGPLSGDGSGEGGSSGGASGGGASGGSAGCGESFTPATLVATPHGEQAIATLMVGQQVTAYDPTTGKQTTQTIERVFIHHDTDRLDVTLAYTSAHSATPSQDAQDATNRPSSGHRRSMPAKDVAPAGQTEVIHTTASHPWLTADHGWARAGTLHVGEAVRLLNGATATVVTLHSLPGAGPMWDLSLDATHTFAVGEVQAVVHNCTDNNVDLASPQRRTHILSGDATGGGHRAGTGIPRKSEFPAEWSDDDIMNAVSDVATDPNSSIRFEGNGRTVVQGTRIVAQTGQRVDIQVVLGNAQENGAIITAYPTNLPRNP